MRKEDILKLRELTGAGIMDCKQALTQARGDLAKAQALLRERGFDKAKRKAGREAREGQIVSYVHGGGKIGVLLEVNCETDFVARNEVFQQFVRDVALQIAAQAEEGPLLDQKFIKDPMKTIRDYLTETMARLGENIVIRRFVRFELGERAKSEVLTLDEKAA